MTFRTLAVAGSVVAALTLAACSDDDGDDNETPEETPEENAGLEADPPAMEADPPAMEADPPAMEADPPAMEADPPAMEADPPAMAAGDAPAFGTDEDIAYGGDIWTALDEAALVGDDVIRR